MLKFDLIGYDSIFAENLKRQKHSTQQLQNKTRVVTVIFNRRNHDIPQ